MQPVTLRPGHLDLNLSGLVLTHTVVDPRDGRRIFRKGQMLVASDAPTLETLLGILDHPIHAVRLEPGDVLEDAAAQRLATALSGDGVAQRKPVQSRVNIEATRKGLLRIDPDAIFTINRHAGIGVFTAVDRLPVLPGKVVAGAKIAPVAIPGKVLAEIETYLANRPHPAATIQVKPFLPHRAGIIVTEGLDERVRDRFEDTVRRKLAWYGSEALRFAHVPSDPVAVTIAAQRLLADGATLLLSAGGNMMDPLDATIQALPDFDAEVIRLGAPAHPGSMFWLGYTASDVPVVNLASCSMYSKSTVADLVLPWIMAGERVNADDLAALGYGGLLDRTTSWRFPPYDAEEADEPDEEG